jgi:hypothetical protein
MPASSTDPNPEFSNLMLKARVIPCLDVKDRPRRPQPRSGEDAQQENAAMRC